jgi:hypothetical protein
MKLSEYLATHEGTYMLAESAEQVSLTMLDEGLVQEEVVLYRHGRDAAGQERIYLSVGGRHVLTYFAAPHADNSTVGR